MGTLAVETKPLHGIKRVPQCNYIGSFILRDGEFTCDGSKMTSASVTEYERIDMLLPNIESSRVQPS